MNKKTKLSDQLRAYELEMLNIESDMATISRKLSIAYKYKEVVLSRLNGANKNITDLQNEYFKKAGEFNLHLKGIKYEFEDYEKHLVK